MFCKFKNWSRRLLENRDNPAAESVGLRKERGEPPLPSRQFRSRSLFVTRRSSISGTVAAPREGARDPRELPRPIKFGDIELPKTKPEPELRKSLMKYCYMNAACQEQQTSGSYDNRVTKSCVCPNCKALPSLTECGVCLEPLQGQKVHSCTVCANLTCKSCASRLQTCAFCRTTLPAVPNVALERLLDRLALPCKNSRLGCTKLVDGDNRIDHEAVCNHSTFSCPVGTHICGWNGDLINVEDHLKAAHDLRPINDNGIAVEISGFRGKAYAHDGRQYTVCLSCYHHLYIVKIVLFQGKLRLSFSQLGGTKASLQARGEASDPSQSYGVWIEVGSGSKVLKGAMPFGKRNCETREIEITCDNIISKQSNDTGGSVKINIVIKSITVV